MAFRHNSVRIAGLLLAGTATFALPLRAQNAGAGFLFREPTVSLTVRGGYARALAGSDIFTFSTDNLTLGKGDFSGFTGGADLGIRLASRIDLMLGAEYTSRNARSEFQKWVGTDDKPIEQTTTFSRLPLTADVKVYLGPRGRRIGRFAWIPAHVTPYIGGGAGFMWYRFRQEGEFVDFNTLEIFPSRLESSGWAPMLQALAGVDVSLTPRFYLSGEARYSRASKSLDNSFDGFEPIDLSGLSATVGLSVRL